MKKFNLLILGLLAGLCSAALGLGGGTVIVPALVIFFAYPIKEAVGTSLATIVPTVFVGIITHYLINSANIRLKIALIVILGAIIGAKLGVDLVNKIHSKTLKRLFALLLLFVGLKIIGVIQIPTEALTSNTVYFGLLILGLIGGLVSSLFGIGGGVVIVPTLTLFFALNIHQAIATSLTIILPTAFIGAIFHKKFNHLNTNALKFLIPSALVGAIIGALLSNSLPADTLKIIFGIYLLITAVKIFFQNNQRK